MRWLALIVVIAAAALVAGCGADLPTASDTTPRPRSSHPEVATGLEVPWGIAFLPDGDALVSERARAQIVRIPAGGGEPEVEMAVPGVDRSAGEGGLLGIAVSPDYAEDGLVYAYLTTAEDNRIVRFRLGEEPEPVLTGLARSQNHNGGRIAFGPDGKLYAGVGDALDLSLPQDPGSLNGKILRLEPDGGVPDDNPTAGSLVWSSGHRNVQGLAWDSAGRLWATEFGDAETDEVNLIRPGANYGWPEVEGVGGEDADLAARADLRGDELTDPLVTWPTSEASPSGAAIVGDDLYVAALRGERLWRVPLNGERVGTPVAELDGELGRLRTVAVAPDGALWVATSNRDGRGSPEPGDDRIVRLDPPGG
jgi:glucose/arabinose dehydrogenase